MMIGDGGTGFQPVRFLGGWDRLPACRPARIPVPPGTLREQMSDAIKQLLSELKNRLGVLYGGRLKGVYLFGSYARDEADEESDVDVLIVLDRVKNYSSEINYTSELISELSLKYGRSISCVYTSERKWREDQTMFFLNVREEAIPV